MPRIPQVTPFLWYVSSAHEAAAFYVSVFRGSKVVRSDPRYAEVKIGPTRLILFNGGDAQKLTPAVSLMIKCKTQKEVDHYWKRLSAGGKVIQCGWIADKFGLCWQVVPEILLKLISDKDEEKAGRAFNAMLGMKKLDIVRLRRAHAGRTRR